MAHPFVQTYRYDFLDRITEAIEKVNGTQTWKQTFGNDRYGNRTSFYQIVGTTVLPINNLTLPALNSNNSNRFADAQGYMYDKNGNLINDPVNGNRIFTFNGDNKQVEVRDSGGVSIGKYFYDGNGRRVKKETNLETTVFVYNGMGNLIAEYSSAAPPTAPTINYTMTDQLGSPRVITNASGQVVSRRDFMPFGEELYPDGTYRKTADKYQTSGQDAVRKRFTGYEKDIETGLDFAEARYYQNQHGRFTAIDPLLASGKSTNPQTFNRYVYVMNSPLRFTDPSGLQAGTAIEEPGIISVITIWFRDVQKALQDRANYLLNGATNISPLDAANYQRSQSRVNLLNGEDDGGLTRRLVGNQGPTVDAVLQQTTDTVRTANTIGNVNIAIQGGLLLIPTPAGTSTVTTNIGTSVLRTSTTAGATTEAAASGAKRFGHIFDKAEHNLGSLVNQLGSRENTFNAVQQAANAALRNGTLVVGNNGILPTGNSGNIVNVAGTPVRLIGGRVIDGEVRISSFSRKGLD